MKVKFVVFSGYNIRALIAFFRTLTRKHIEFDIIACTNEDFIFHTSYAKNVAYTRQSRELMIDEITLILQRIKAKSGDVEAYYILPSSEFLNRFLLRNREVIEELGFSIPLVEEDVYELLSDKRSFGELCEKNSIKIPEEIKQIPMVAKPKKYFSTDSRAIAPYLILNEEEYTQFKDKENEEDFFFQRYISGESIYLLCYFYKDGTVDTFSQRNLMQQTGGKSIIAAEYSNFWTTEEAEKYILMLKKLNYRGLIMIEIRKEKFYYMIEANPRIWGPSQFLVDSEANLLESMLYDIGAIEKKPDVRGRHRSDAKYFWKDGIEEKFVLHCDEQEIKEKWSELEKYDIFARSDINREIV